MAAANAPKQGVAYEIFLKNKLEDAFDKERKNNPFQGTKGNVQVDVQAMEIAGNGSGSDLEGLATLHFKTTGFIQKGVRVEVKHIKNGEEEGTTGNLPSSEGLDFGQFSVLYVLNRTEDEKPDRGCWIANVTGNTWKKSKGKNIPLIMNTVGELNRLHDTEFVNHAPIRYQEEQEEKKMPLWSAFNPNKAKPHLEQPENIQVMEKYGIDPTRAIVIEGLNEHVYRVPNKDGGYTYVNKLDKRGNPTNQLKFENETFAERGIEPENERIAAIIKADKTFVVKQEKDVIDENNEYAQQILNYYATKGDDFLQIKHYGLFALRTEEYYKDKGASPPYPPEWHDDFDSMHFGKILSGEESKISVRFRMKGHGNVKNGVHNYTCAIKFSLPKVRSPHNLSSNDTVDALVKYWNKNLHKLQSLQINNLEGFEELDGPGCIASGTKKKRGRRRSSTRRRGKARRTSRR